MNEIDASSIDSLVQVSFFGVEPQKVGNMALHLDVNYRSALPWQCNREVVVNAREAGATEVAISPDFYYLKQQIDAGIPPEQRIHRWMAEDNGQGMSIDQLRAYPDIGISGTSKEVGILGNFGMGAKVSLLPGNHGGLVVISYQDYVGSMIQIRRVNNPDGSACYGLVRYEGTDEDGNEVVDCVIAPPSVYDTHFNRYIGKVGTRRKQGTLIIAVGHTGDEDTFREFPSDSAQNRYLTRWQHAVALNRRFFDLGGIKVRCFEQNSPDVVNKDTWVSNIIEREADATGQFRSVEGHKAVYDEYSTASGTVPVTNGKVHWWLFGDDDKHAHAFHRTVNSNAKTHRNYPSLGIGTGLTAVLYKGELYDHVSAPGRLRAFNIFQDWGRYAFIFEPDLTTKMFTTDLLRRHVQFCGEDISWNAIGADFCRNLPDAILQFQKREPPLGRDRTALRQKVLKTFMAQVRPSITARDTNGVTPKGSTSNKVRTRTTKGAIAAKAKAAVVGRTMADFDWKPSGDDKTRPAFYNRAENKLYLLVDHPFYSDLTNEWLDRYARVDMSPPGLAEEIRSQVDLWSMLMALTYISTVIGVRRSKDFTSADLEKMLSDEALAGVIFSLRSGLYDHMLLQHLLVYGKPAGRQ